MTWEDATAGFVENQAQLTYHYDVNGPKSGQAYSNKVTAPTGLLWISIEGFDTAIGGIGLVKSVTSAPANGMFYVPGETVTFHVDITNHDKINTLLNLAVDDPMMAEYEGVFKAMAIDPGVTLGFSFDYVVSPMDAIAGSISNVATGVVFDGDGNRYANVSNADDMQARMDRKYIAKTYTDATFGQTYDASALGEYSLIFHENGTCDFGIAGTVMSNLPWGLQEVSVGLNTVDAFVVNFYGMMFNAVLTDEGFDMDYYGTMTLHFVPAE